MGVALGIEGDRKKVKNKMHKYEYGQKEVPEWIAAAVAQLERRGIMAQPPQATDRGLPTYRPPRTKGGVVE